MRKLSGVLLASFLVCGGTTFLTAQNEAEGNPPPKVLVIYRETVKPGKAGNAHLKTESAFVQAMASSKHPIHYLGMDSLSGTSRSLYFMGYPSFAEWENENQRVQQDGVLSAAMDRAEAADGELLSDFGVGVFTYREEYSLPKPTVIGTMRYMDITAFHIRPGHRKDWSELVKMYQDLYKKNVPDATWAVYEMMYGPESDLYLVITPLKSVGEIDQHMTADDAMMKGVSAEDKAKLASLTEAAVLSSVSNLYQFNPKTSFPIDSWVKADPTFWQSKALAMKQTAKEAKADTLAAR